MVLMSLEPALRVDLEDPPQRAAEGPAAIGSMMTETTGPDFLCIGMQKAGTGWLYDQLQFHPDFWMPPIKEFHYFDRSFPDKTVSETITLALEAPERLARKRARSNWRQLDDRDTRFFADARTCAGRGIDLAQYAALFRHKGGLMSGDITPAYSTLSEELIARIAGHFPQIKVILLLREPVARLWSQISMAHRKGKFEADWLDDPDELRAYLQQPKVMAHTFPTGIHARWTRHVPEPRLRTFFFDHIESRPQEVRRDILAFLGAEPGKESGELEAGFNRKSNQPKLELTDEVRAVLVEHLADEVRACARQFGGPAEAWPARYGL